MNTRLSAEPFACKAVRRIVARMERNLQAREDLLQEGLVHIWSRIRQRPAQRAGWYLKSVKFHLQHIRASGRSLDSPKRVAARAALGDNADHPNQLLDALLGVDDGAMSEIHARDIRSVLIGALEPIDQAILVALDEGWTGREVASRLSKSHESVRRHRQKIAAAALKLGILPLTRDSNRPLH
jgi:DNA-directed RNA polymerase specialized sigma24 family protein